MSKIRLMTDELRNMLAERGLENADEMIKFSLLANSRLISIVRALDLVKNVPGDTAEIGCHAGGTSFFIGSLNGGKPHWAFDTFAGMQDVGDVDTDLWNGQFSAESLSAQSVINRLSPLKNVNVIQGFFPECAPEFDGKRFSFVNIDVDSYASMRTCIDYFIPCMSKGGIIAMDDVIGKGTMGGKKAWEETDKTNLQIVSETNPQVIVMVV